MHTENKGQLNGNGAGAGLAVAVLFHRLGPYHHARLRAAGEGLQVTAIEFSNVDRMYDWELLEGANGFKRVRLFHGEAAEGLPARRVAARMAEALEAARPQVVAIPGWSDRCALAALAWCGRRGVPAVVMSETTSWDFPRHGLKETIKRRLLRRFSTGLAGGRAHARYLAELGLGADRVFLGYDAVDNAYFAAQAAAARSRAEVLRREHGLPVNYFLASARFVAKKNLEGLIRAYGAYRRGAEAARTAGRGGEPWDLVLLGDGPLRPALTALIQESGLAGHVLLPGFKQYAELPVYYALARVFIHASTTEQWGLVVNEAMAAGLPVLVSRRCGCAEDLVVEGVTGFGFEPDQPEALTALLRRCAEPGMDLAGLGAAAARHVADWGVERFAAGLGEAAAAARRAPRQPPAWLDQGLIRLLLAQKDRVST